MSHRHIEKGMFMQGGACPVRVLARENSELFASLAQHAEFPPPIPPQFPPLDEIRSRLQHLQEALDYIRSEKPPAVETQEQWLKRMGWW